MEFKLSDRKIQKKKINTLKIINITLPECLKKSQS